MWQIYKLKKNIFFIFLSLLCPAHHQIVLFVYFGPLNTKVAFKIYFMKAFVFFNLFMEFLELFILSISQVLIDWCSLVSVQIKCNWPFYNFLSQGNGLTLYVFVYLYISFNISGKKTHFIWQIYQTILFSFYDIIYIHTRMCILWWDLDEPIAVLDIGLANWRDKLFVSKITIWSIPICMPLWWHVCIARYVMC